MVTEAAENMAKSGLGLVGKAWNGAKSASPLLVAVMVIGIATNPALAFVDGGQMVVSGLEGVSEGVQWAADLLPAAGESAAEIGIEAGAGVTEEIVQETATQTVSNLPTLDY